MSPGQYSESIFKVNIQSQYSKSVIPTVSLAKWQSGVISKAKLFECIYIYKYITNTTLPYT